MTWWPVALSHALRDQPLACLLHDTRLVLFRDENGGPGALPDRCPHRFAPLSAGKVRAGQIECPYHGWRFAADGRCTRVPGSVLTTCSKPLLESLATRDAHGLVWVSLDNSLDQPVGPAEQREPLDTFWITDQVRCSLQDAAENFLDGFHTHFVHAGWIRRDTQRQRISVTVRSLADGVEALYSEEGKQSGWISRLLEGSRGLSMGRFRLPGLAEIEYRDRQGALNLLVSAWIVPCGGEHLRLFARVATRRGWLPAALKRRVLRRVFTTILRQDRDILEKVSENTRRFRQLPATPLDGPQDLLGPSIRRMLEDGQAPEFAERTLEIWL